MRTALGETQLPETGRRPPGPRLHARHMDLRLSENPGISPNHNDSGAVAPSATAMSHRAQPYRFNFEACILRHSGSSSNYAPSPVPSLRRQHS